MHRLFVRNRHLSWLVASLTLTGCLPHSCQRIESTELFPSDSLSRQIAGATPTDTLELLWTYPRAGEAPGLEYPRTVIWSPSGELLYVADTGSGRVAAVAADGGLARVVDIPGVKHPYIAGWREDTLVILDPDRRQLLYAHGGGVERTVVLPFEGREVRSYLYATVTEAGSVVKAVRRGARTQILDLSHMGDLEGRRYLEGPHWRHAGFLLPWESGVLSLCGYRPVIDLLNAGSPDSLLLQGFDSPMLSRSRRFVLGEVDQPPLMIASADAAGDRLFVLNLRPTGLRVDTYDHSGMLQRILAGPPEVGFNYYPVDLAVQETDGGDLLIAISTVEPVARVELYRWRPNA